MIKRYLPNETTWEHNKFVLKPINATVTEEANGMFELEIELPKGTELNKRDIITAPTPRGDQPFRVYRIVKTLYGIRVNAKHIFYDLADSLLLDARPTNQSGNGALQTIITASGLTGWTYFSDISSTGTAYYIRKNPVEAIMGADNCLLKVWGGNLLRNKKDIRVISSGLDRGYEIRLGKNLVGIEDDSDDSAVVTRLYPTYEKDNVIFDLPEKYIDSPLINNYISPIVREERVSLTDAEKELPLAEIHELIRTYCQNLFTHDNVDKPIINYKVDFVELSKYRSEEFLQLEKIDLYDIVTVDVAELDIKLKARVIKYTYDAVGKKYTGIELGGFKPSAKYSTDNLVKQIEIDKEKASDEFKALFDLAINTVTGNKGGYQVTKVNASGEPYETLWMDTPNMNTAVNVLRINKEGIAGSVNGINGPYATAITTDGWIVAERIMANQLSAITADLGTVIAGRIEDADNESYWDLDKKEIKLNVNELKIQSKDVATKADLTYTSESLTARFSQIGGANMIENSEGINFAGYDGSDITVTRNVSVPEWGATNAIMVNAPTGNGTTMLKAYSVLYNNPTEMNGKMYTLSVYAKNERDDASVTIGSFRYGSETLAPGEMKRVIISGDDTNDRAVQIQISAQTPAYYARVTLWHPQLESRGVATEWTPHPKELYTGIIEADKDGLRVSRTGTEVSAGLAYDGLRLMRSDTGTPISSFTTDGVDADTITAKDIRSATVARVLSEDVTVYVGASETGDGSGRDSSNKASSVARALNTALDGAVYFMRYPTVTVNVSGSINEMVRIRGLSGHGRILLTGDSTARIVGTIEGMNTSCLIEIDGIKVVNGEDSANQLIIGNNATRMLVRNCSLDGYGKGYGIGANASNIHAIDCDFFRLDRALTASVNGNIHCHNSGGSLCEHVASAVYGGRVSLSGTRVAFNTALSLTGDGGTFIDDSTGLNTKPYPGYIAPTWATKTVTFDADEIYTANVSNGYVWNRTEWRQGTWEGNGNAVRGYANFGSKVRDWLNSSGGYQGTPTITISAKRNASSGNKGNGAVSMMIGNPATLTLPAVPYGGGSSSATTGTALRNAIMTSSKLVLSSSTTSLANYGAFYDIKIKVTAQKKV